MFWKEELCVLVNYLETNSVMPSFITEKEKEEEDKINKFEWIKTLSIKESAKELIKFKDEISPKSYWLDTNIIRLFWQKKGLNSIYNLSSEEQLKINTIESEAKIIIDNNRDKKEKEKLEFLIKNCYSWAKINKSTKLTKADINAFLVENSEELSTDNKGVLYSKVNMKLKLEL